jgi:hypothetical protein
VTGVKNRFEAAYEAVSGLSQADRMRALDDNIDVTVSARINNDPTDYSRTARNLGYLVRKLNQLGSPTSALRLSVFEKPDGTLAAHDSQYTISQGSGLLVASKARGTIPPHSQELAVRSAIDAVENFLETTSS